MLDDELSSDMDRITQLQDAILDLLTITHSAIEYITKRTAFEQVSASIPVTTVSPWTAKKKDYDDAVKAFVGDITNRSKDIERLISALPKKEDSEARAQRLQNLQKEMVAANREYKEALSEAEDLMRELESVLGAVLENGKFSHGSMSDISSAAVLKQPP